MFSWCSFYYKPNPLLFVGGKKTYSSVSNDLLIDTLQWWLKYYFYSLHYLTAKNVKIPHPTSLFFLPVEGDGVGNMGVRIWNYTKTLKAISLAGTRQRIPSTVTRGDVSRRASAGLGLRGLPPSPPLGKWPGRATRGYSPAAVLTSRMAHGSQGTRQGRCSEEVIPGPAKKQEGKEKKYGK